MTAPIILSILHWVSGFIVLAYGLQRLEILDPCRRGIDLKLRLMLVAESAGWIVLSIGGGGAVITPLLPLESPTLQDACTMTGVAVCVVMHHAKRRWT